MAQLVDLSKHGGPGAQDLRSKQLRAVVMILDAGVQLGILAADQTNVQNARVLRDAITTFFAEVGHAVQVDK